MTTMRGADDDNDSATPLFTLLLKNFIIKYLLRFQLVITLMIPG